MTTQEVKNFIKNAISRHRTRDYRFETLGYGIYVKDYRGELFKTKIIVEGYRPIDDNEAFKITISDQFTGLNKKFVAIVDVDQDGAERLFFHQDILRL